MSRRERDHRRNGDRPTSSGIVLRLLIVFSPLAAVAITWLAADRTLVPVAAVVVLLSLVSAASPTSHFGALVVAAVAIQWVATVHDHVTPLSIGVAAALTMFHAALAAATVAPVTAEWTAAMRRRWSRRAAALLVACASMWAVVAIANANQLGASTVLLTTALVILASGALWARNGSLGQRRPE